MVVTDERADQSGQAAQARGASDAERLTAQTRTFPKILHVAETIKGGVGTHLTELARIQFERGGEGKIRLLIPLEHRLQVRLLPNGIVRTFERKGRSLGSFWRLVRRTLEEVAAFEPDIIHAHSTFAGLVVRLLFGWRARRPRIIYCPHGWAFAQRRVATNIFFRTCERLLASLCDLTIAVSEHEAVLAAELGIKPDRCRVTMNGIAENPPADRPMHWVDDRLKILFVGRLDPAKGFDVLLEAVEGLEDKIVLRVAGEAVVDERLRPKAYPNVTYLGWLSASEIEGALAEADLVAIPSRNEAFGFVALEAMRAGKMVVASAVGGLLEIIEDGVTGRLVPLADPLALRAALLQDGADARAQMGLRGRERFLKQFTAVRMEESIAALYGDLMAARDASANPIFRSHAHAPMLSISNGHGADRLSREKQSADL